MSVQSRVRILRERWERQAGTWERHREWFQSGVAPVSHAMIELLNPQPGHVVLEAAAGASAASR